MKPVRHSYLKAMGRSPAHCRLAMEADMIASAAMERGTAAHAILFGTQRVMPYSGKVRRGKQWDAFVEKNDGALILTQGDYEKCTGMAEAVRAHSEAWPLLQGVTESTLTFDIAGRACRATPDVRGDGFLTELKTTANSDPNRFGAHALKLAYHSQMAMQREAVIQSKLSKPEACYIVAVEQSAPFAVTVLRLTDRALDAGDRLWRSWLERLLVCERSGHWPGYSDAVVDLDVPDDLELDWGSVLERAQDDDNEGVEVPF